jgi:DNA-binding GntR family transcriptional regulator
MQLVREGGLELRPGRELRVAVVTLKRYAEICTVRAPLERLAVELATPLISGATLNILDEINREFFEAEKQKDVKRAISLNSRFHLTLYSASENDLLIKTIENLWMLTVPLLNKQYPLTAHRHNANHPHSRLIAALRQGAAAQAAQLVIDDLRKGSALILKKLRGDDQYDDGTPVVGPYLR